MTFRRGARIDPSQVTDVRGRRMSFGGGGFGPMAAGGGGLGLIVVIVLVVLGGGDFLGGGQPVAPVDDTTGRSQECRTGEDANQRQDCRIVGFVNSIQAHWSDAFAERDARYQQADTVLFTEAVQSGCGPASSATGPFYCPQDGLIYLDLGFFDALETRLGAQGGPLAEGYVIAHEYGHHVQNLLGVLQPGGGAGQDSRAVATELQADCYAGVWAANAVATGYLEVLTESEVRQALDAAAAVGDDRVQQRTGGQVDPDTWTHGSAEQRQAAFAAGYRDGDPEVCAG